MVVVLRAAKICSSASPLLLFLSSEAGGEQDRGAGRVLVIPEGAAMPEALLGSIRLVRWLAQESELAGRECHLVVDSGTGATATGTGP